MGLVNREITKRQSQAKSEAEVIKFEVGGKNECPLEVARLKRVGLIAYRGGPTWGRLQSAVCRIPCHTLHTRVVKVLLSVNLLALVILALLTIQQIDHISLLEMPFGTISKGSLFRRNSDGAPENPSHTAGSETPAAVDLINKSGQNICLFSFDRASCPNCLEGDK